jgi:hypothetical protein
MGVDLCWPGLFSRSSRLTEIAGAILLLACHLFTERPGRHAHS